VFSKLEMKQGFGLCLPSNELAVKYKIESKKRLRNMLLQHFSEYIALVQLKIIYLHNFL